MATWCFPGFQHSLSWPLIGLGRFIYSRDTESGVIERSGMGLTTADHVVMTRDDLDLV